MLRIESIINDDWEEEQVLMRWDSEFNIVGEVNRSQKKKYCHFEIIFLLL